MYKQIVDTKRQSKALFLKKLRINLCVIFLLVSSFSANGQNLQHKNELRLLIGYIHSYFKDLNFSPLNYRGKGGGCQIEYVRKSASEKQIVEASIDIGISSLNSNLHIRSSSHISSHLHLAFLQKILSRKKLRLYIGPAYLTDINSLSYEFEDNSAFSFVFAHSLNFKSLVEFPIGIKQQLSSSFSFPIITLLVRPPYNGFDEKTEWFTEPIGTEQYLKPVILLTDRFTASAAEIFVLNMRAFEQVTILGDTTAGDHSDQSNVRFLPNGWLYNYSIKLFLLPDNSSLEGIGIAPEIYVKNTKGDIDLEKDRVLESAIQYLFDEYEIQ